MAGTKVDVQAVQAELNAICSRMTGVTRLMGPQVWQGGSAGNFTTDLQGHNRSLDLMMLRVLRAVAALNDLVMVLDPPDIPSVTPQPALSNGIASVSPNGLRQLESNLRFAAEALPRHGSRIQALLSAAGPHDVSTVQCTRAAAWCSDQARQMRTRIHYALASDNVSPMLGVMNRGLTQIPDTARFGRSELEQLAKLQAQAYRKNLEHPSEGSQAALADIGESLQENSKDGKYLKTFFDAVPADSIGKLAITLSRQHKDEGLVRKTILDSKDKQILANFGTAVAAASRKKVLNRRVQDALGSSGGVDMWSSAMLLKMGPPGKDWDPEFLAGMTNSILAWSRRQREAYMPHPPPSPPYETFRKPFNDTEQWALDLGLNSADPMTASQHRAKVKHVTAQWDPVIPVLKRATENGTAARLSLGNYKDPASSARAAGDLIDPLWLERHPNEDLESQVNEFLKAATTAKRGGSDDMRMAAQSFASILDAVSKLPDRRESVKIVIPAETRHTLTHIAGAYGHDLMRSVALANTSNGAVSITPPNDKYWLTLSNPQYVQTFLQKVLIDPEDLGYFKGVTDALTVTAVDLQSKGKTGDQDLIPLIGRLQAARQLAENAHRLEGAQEKDRQAKIRKAAFDVALNYFGQLPTVGYGKDIGKEHTGLQKTQQLVDHTQPFMDSAMGKAEKNRSGILFAGNEGLARQMNQASIDDARVRMRNLVIQGLINAGELTPPKDATWLESGVVVPVSDINKSGADERTNLDVFAGNHSKTINAYRDSMLDVFNASLQVDKTGTPQ
ncbi:hypothetical protein [Actinomadura sp. HBU206391]|uniref:hypothetical protein n=1 Tax=Actinomadura sp. HBU206391 TaxID=2731692 RepID=UPI00164F845F|nr:hypothetical protein [Actinomadura sp. HBU206391]MBC6459632.1 hypothetical protein [Actinomadura sp. HBU206391]